MESEQRLSLRRLPLVGVAQLNTSDNPHEFLETLVASVNFVRASGCKAQIILSFVSLAIVAETTEGEEKLIADHITVFLNALQVEGEELTAKVEFFVGNSADFLWGQDFYKVTITSKTA